LFELRAVEESQPRCADSTALYHSTRLRIPVHAPSIDVVERADALFEFFDRTRSYCICPIAESIRHYCLSCAGLRSLGQLIRTPSSIAGKKPAKSKTTFAAIVPKRESISAKRYSESGSIERPLTFEFSRFGWQRVTSLTLRRLKLHCVNDPLKIM
jgi:hypothetical protein